MVLKENITIVWFKRDLRLHDHEALSSALKFKNVVPLYILEPNLWKLPDMSLRQYDFLNECLIDLQQQFRDHNANLVIKVGESVDIFRHISEIFNIENIFAHQETWNWWTYQRDIEVEEFCRRNSINFYQPRQNGVIRRLKDRKNWAKRWYDFMSGERFTFVESDNFLKFNELSSDPLPTGQSLGLMEDDCIYRQTGTRKEAVNTLLSFIETRSFKYHKRLSSPLTAFEGCSRLSPLYFFWGYISKGNLPNDTKKY